MNLKEKKQVIPLEEKLTGLYDYIASCIMLGDNSKKDQIVYPLTREELLYLDFTDKNIRTLVDKGILNHPKRGQYITCDSNKLVGGMYLYGEKLLESKEEKQENRGEDILEACYIINPMYTSFELFYRCILTKNYEIALDYYKELVKTDNPYFYADLNYYLYLLSKIIDLPSEYQTYVNSFGKGENLYDAIKIPEIDFQYKDLQEMDPRYKAQYQRIVRNSIRWHVAEDDYQAIEPLMSTFGLDFNESSKKTDEIEFLLLEEAIQKDKKFQNQIESNLYDRDYDGLLARLKEKQTKEDGLSPYYYRFLKLASQACFTNTFPDILYHHHLELERTGGIRVIPMRQNKAELATEIVRASHYDMRAEIITFQNNTYLVLRRYMPDSNFDFEAKRKQAQYAYYQNDYNLVIKEYEELMAKYENPPADIYKSLGYTYKHINNYKMACRYFKIASAKYAQVGDLRYSKSTEEQWKQCKKELSNSTVNGKDYCYNKYKKGAKGWHI